MPIIIDEFEAIAASPPAPGPAGESAEEDRNEKQDLEPLDVKPALTRLAERALRCWAH